MNNQLLDQSNIIKEISNEEELFEACNLLAQVRKAYNKYDDEKSQRIAPTKQTIKLLTADYDKLLKPLAAAEEQLKEVIQTFGTAKITKDTLHLAKMIEETGDVNLEMPLGFKSVPTENGDIRFRVKNTFEITDESLVPIRFMSIDSKKIQAYIDEQVDDVVIPGVKLTKTSSVAIYTHDTVLK